MNNAERRAVRRRARDAGTRLRLAVWGIRREADEATTEEQRWLAGYEAQTLLVELLADALDLTEALHQHDDFDVAELAAAARAVHDRLRALRLAAKLDQVEGRTPEEAAAFRGKADELRGVVRS